METEYVAPPSKIYTTLDAVVFLKDDEKIEEPKVLLIKRRYPPDKDKWALPGGHLEPDESLEDGCLRELYEETNLMLHPINITFSSFYDSLNRDPRGRYISFAFYTVLHKIPKDIKAKDDATETEWFPVTSLPETAFDHQLIIKEAFVHSLRYKRNLNYVNND